MAYIGHLSEFHLNMNWNSYQGRFQQFLLANKIEKEREVPVFLSIIGDEAYSLLCNLCYPDNPSDKTLADLNSILTNHLKPATSYIAERYKFRNCMQIPGESVSLFLTRLKQASMTCKFGPELNDQLRDQFICGLRDKSIQRRLLETKDIAFDTAVEIATATELVRKQVDNLGTNSVTPTEDIHAFKRTKEVPHLTNCGRCGSKHNANKCPAKHWTCYACKKKGHIAKVCRTKPRPNPRKIHHLQKDSERSHTNINVQSVTAQNQSSSHTSLIDEQEEEDNFILSLKSHCKRLEIVVNIEGKPITMEIDTGASMSVMPETTYLKYLSHIPWESTGLKLKTYTGESIAAKGKLEVSVQFRDQRYRLPLYIIPSIKSQPSDVLPLIGRNWMQYLELPWTEILQTRYPMLNQVPELNSNEGTKAERDLMHKCREVFQLGTGCIKEVEPECLIQENAETLSRAPVNMAKEDEELPGELNFFTPLRESPLRPVDIAKATRTDPILSRVVEWTKYGWPEQVEAEFIPFLQRRLELSLEQECVLWGTRVIIPQKLRCQVLELLHEEHTGIVGMKRLARGSFWWPNLDRDVENLANACVTCKAMAPSVPPVRLHTWEPSCATWERIHLDFAFWRSHNLMVVIDSYSKWVEIKILPTLNSTTIIDHLRTLFASYGLPHTIVHDNISYLVWAEMAAFLKAQGIKQLLTPPYHPASNGPVERAVRSLKSSIKKGILDELRSQHSRSLQHKIDGFLFAYRSTPHNTTGVSPAELFLRRPLRNRITMLKPNLMGDLKNKGADKYQSISVSRRAQDRNFQLGDKVLVKSVRNKQVNWLPGVIVGKRGKVIFEVSVNDKNFIYHADHIKSDPNA